MTPEERTEFLRNWATFNTNIHTLDEETIKALIEHECSNKRRTMFIERLHQRYTKMRSGRERITLLLGGGLI